MERQVGLGWGEDVDKRRNELSWRVGGEAEVPVVWEEWMEEFFRLTSRTTAGIRPPCLVTGDGEASRSCSF